MQRMKAVWRCGPWAPLLPAVPENSSLAAVLGHPAFWSEEKDALRESRACRVQFPLSQLTKPLLGHWGTKTFISQVEIRGLE